jgi:hypothetical protein
MFYLNVMLIDVVRLLHRRSCERTQIYSKLNTTENMHFVVYFSNAAINLGLRDVEQ